MTAAIAPRRRQAALGFIFVTALLDVMSLGIMIPVLPNLIKAFNGGDTAAASVWNVAFATSWGLMQFLFSPVVGMMSDRWGRRPVLLISIFGLGVDYLFMALAPTLAWLWVGRIINGITAASFSTCSAYIADVTPPQGRAKAFGFVGAAWSLGFLFGPALGGALAEIDLRLPFFVCAGLALANWLYGYFVLPESLAPEKRRDVDWRRANPLGALANLSKIKGILPIASIYFLWVSATNIYPASWTFFAPIQFGWDSKMVGISLTLVGVSLLLFQSLVIGRAVKRFGERNTAINGMAFGLASFTITAFLTNGDRKSVV